MKGEQPMEDRKEEQASVPYFVHEGMMTRMEEYSKAAMDRISQNNHRMFVALVTVCITFVVTIIIFVVGYTVRNKHWIDCVQQLQQPAASEVVPGDDVYK